MVNVVPYVRLEAKGLKEIESFQPLKGEKRRSGIHARPTLLFACRE
jgi:hypothetical protein